MSVGADSAAADGDCTSDSAVVSSATGGAANDTWRCVCIQIYD